MHDNNELRLRIAKLLGYRWFSWKGKLSRNYNSYLFTVPSETMHADWVEIGDPAPKIIERYIKDPDLMIGIRDWPTDWSDAAELLKLVEDAGLRWMLYTLPDGRKNFAILGPLVLDGEECHRTIAEAQGATGPEAIARAVLEWKEGAK
jgi:hypothetical protein